MARSHPGRGRLSAIELLPDACTPFIVKAADELKARERTQTAIYEEFFRDLQQLQQEHRGELEFTIPSFSAFNRYSLNLAALTRRLEETREIAGSIAKSFDVEASDNLTLIAAEAIKTLVFEVVTGAGESGIDPKGAMQLASALRSAAQAQGVSTLRRQKVEKEFAAKVDETVDQVAKVKGLSEETAEQIKAQILGVKKKDQ